MSDDSCLVLYGNSVFLAGIKAELESHTGLELITIEAGCPDVINLVQMHRPRAVLFDLGTGQMDAIVSLLQRQPGLLLIGVDPSSDKLLVLSGQPVQALSLADLFAVIYQKQPDSGLSQGER